MAADEASKESEYHDFKCQFDTSYAASVVKGHKEWIEKNLVPEIRSKFRESNSYRILSVGSGTGYPDQGLLEILSGIAKDEGIEKRKIIYTVSEPDPKAVEVCKENVEKASKNLNIDFKYDIATSEKFLLQLEEEFDLIHFVHVISWLKGYEAILARCFEKLLAKNGLIALVDFNPASFGCESEECCKENAEKTPEIKEEAGSGEHSEEEQDGSMYVKVDLIANKHGWSCKKFPYDLKVDLTEAGKPTEAGRKMACVWMHADGSKMSEEEKEKNRADLINSLTKEEVNGETKYFYVLNEMIYFLTK